MTATATVANPQVEAMAATPSFLEGAALGAAGTKGGNRNPDGVGGGGGDPDETDGPSLEGVGGVAGGPAGDGAEAGVGGVARGLEGDGAEAGVGRVAGGLAGDGAEADVGGVAGGPTGVGGGAEGVVEAATMRDIFWPASQWPLKPQMKYLVPAEVSCTEAGPAV